MHAQEQDREEIAQARARWKNNQRRIPAGKLVFIDGTGTNTQMSRRYGRCAKKRAIDWQGAVGSVENYYFCCCLTLQGVNGPHGAG